MRREAKVSFPSSVCTCLCTGSANASQSEGEAGILQHRRAGHRHAEGPTTPLSRYVAPPPLSPTAPSIIRSMAPFCRLCCEMFYGCNCVMVSRVVYSLGGRSNDPGNMDRWAKIMSFSGRRRGVHCKGCS